LLRIDCHELTLDEQLALASEISDDLSGRALAFVDGEWITVDEIDPNLGELPVKEVVQRFVSKRPESGKYGLEEEEGKLVVRSDDPLKRTRGRQHASLPDNLKQCPFCPFVTQYGEAYVVHVRSHGFT
jgi:hypothetical protein